MNCIRTAKLGECLQSWIVPPAMPMLAPALAHRAPLSPPPEVNSIPNVHSADRLQTCRSDLGPSIATSNGGANTCIPACRFGKRLGPD
jgi:hypothetical protein